MGQFLANTGKSKPLPVETQQNKHFHDITLLFGITGMLYRNFHILLLPVKGCGKLFCCCCCSESGSSVVLLAFPLGTGKQFAVPHQNYFFLVTSKNYPKYTVFIKGYVNSSTDHRLSIFYQSNSCGIWLYNVNRAFCRDAYSIDFFPRIPWHSVVFHVKFLENI